MEEEYDDYGDPNQFEEFSGDLDINYIKEFATLLGMHPIRDHRLLWDIDLPGWLLVRNYKQEFCWVNEELMQVEKLPPNLNDLKSQFIELRKEYVRLINSGVSADEASRPETIFARFLNAQTKQAFLELPMHTSGQAVRQFDTAERSSQRRVGRGDLDSEESHQGGKGATGQRGRNVKPNNQLSEGRGQTQTKGRDPVGLDSQYSAGRASGNTGSGRFTEPRKTEEESNKKLDPRQALFASASASVNESGNKQPRQLTGRQTHAVAIDEDYNDDPDGLFEYQTDVKGKVAHNRARAYDHDLAVDLDGDMDDGAEEMFIDGYEEHDLDQLVEEDEERAVAYRVSQDEIEDYIGSEKQSKANMAESDFRDQGSRNLRSSRGKGEPSLRNSSAASQMINDPIYLQLRSELDAIKQKINSLEGEHVELRNINSQLMTRSGGAKSQSQGSLPMQESQHSMRQEANFMQDQYRRSDLQDSTDQQIEQELKEIKDLIMSSLGNQSAHQNQSPVSRLLANNSTPQEGAAHFIQAGSSQPHPKVLDPSHQAFYFNSAFSLGAPTAYLSPGDPLADNPSIPAQRQPAAAPQDLAQSNGYPPNPYLKESGPSLLSSGASNGRPQLTQPPLALLSQPQNGLPPLPPGAPPYLWPQQPTQPHHHPSNPHQRPLNPQPSSLQPPNSLHPQTPMQPLSNSSGAMVAQQTWAHKPTSSSLRPSQSAAESSSLASSDARRHTANGRSGASGKGLDASGLALYHKWRDILRGEWKAVQHEEDRIAAETRVVKSRKKGIREMEWEVLHVLGERGSSPAEAQADGAGPISRITESVIEGLRYAVFLYELDTEKLYLLNDILRSRTKKLKDIEKSLKIALKAGRVDTMTDDYLTLVFYQYMELCNLYELKWRIDTQKLVPYRKYNKSSMIQSDTGGPQMHSKFYKTEFLDGSRGPETASDARRGKVFDESLSHFDFLKESLQKLKDGTLLPGEAVRIYSEIDLFFENQHVWFSQIKQDIKVVMKRLNNPTNLSALRNA